MSKLKKLLDDVRSSPFRKITNDLIDLFPGSKIFLSGGALSDLYHNEEPHDYDPSIFGVTYEKLLSKLKKRFEVISYNEREGFVEYNDGDLQKNIDIHTQAPQLINPLDDIETFRERYQYQMEESCSVSFETYMEECLNSDQCFDTAGNIMVNIESERVYCLRKNDFKDLSERILRLYNPERLSFSVDVIFRVIKKGSTGFDICSDTRKEVIENSKIDYILWANSRVEKDLYSLIRDRFLATLSRVELQNDLEGSSSGDFEKFLELTQDSGVLSSVFDIEEKEYDYNFESKEEVLLHIFESDENVRSVFSDNYLFRNFYNL